LARKECVGELALAVELKGPISLYGVMSFVEKNDALYQVSITGEKNIIVVIEVSVT
jgi:hypothetical protein